MLTKIISGACLLLVLPNTAMAGFLDMPNVEETPELERKSLLRDLDIPSVRERDPDPQAGPRLDVREFRLQGLVEYPDLGITRNAIIKQVEGIRFDMMAEGERLDSGYTVDELAELSDLIAEIEDETGEEHVGPLEVQRLVFLIREQRRRRGITLGMIETVADTITQYYRERGFILAKAYIPEQHVRDGIVTLTLLLGNLGEVEANNNRKYRENTLRSPFNNMMGKPVTSAAIEERLYLLNDLPGLSAQGYFEPGSQVGDTKLNINVLREKTFSYNLRTDNHGGEQNGEYRLYGDFQWNNLTGFGDRLTVSGLYAAQPGSTIYGSLRYGINIFSPRFGWEIGASSNAFKLGRESEGEEITFQDLIEIEGQSNIIDTAFFWQQTRSRKKNFRWSLGVEQIESIVDSAKFENFKDLYTDVIQNASLIFSFDLLQEEKKRLHQGSVKVTQGNIAKGLSPDQDETFSILNIDYTLLGFANIPFTSVESRVVTRAALQYSGARLSSVSQFGLGGPIRTRGFSSNEYFADDAVFFSADWILSGVGFWDINFAGNSFNDILQPFLFFDSGMGRSNPRLNGEREQIASMADAGFGLKLSAGPFRGNLQVALPLVGEAAREQPISAEGGGVVYVETVSEFDDKPRLYFDFQYSF